MLLLLLEMLPILGSLTDFVKLFTNWMEVRIDHTKQVYTD